MKRDSQSDRNDKLDALLAQGRMSGSRRDQVLAGALAKARPPARRWAWLGLGSLSLAAAAAAVLLLMPTSPFRARGSAGAVLEVDCVGGGQGGCAEGSMLMFHVSGASDGGFLTAWAEPTAGGERIWYFPTKATPQAQVAKQAEPQTLGLGVMLGAEQPKGSYVVHLLLTPTPLTRDDALAMPHKPLGQALVPLVVR